MVLLQKEGFTVILLSLFGISFGQPIALFLLIPAVVAFLYFNKELVFKKKKLPVIILRTLTVLVLFLVLASPYVIRENEILQESTSILIIDDNTDSMQIHGASVATSLIKSLDARNEKTSQINHINITTSNRTALGDSIYQGLLSSSLRNSVVILLTDGLSNYGADSLDVASFAAETNTRIFSVIPETIKNEIYVSKITGSKKTPVNSEYSASVVIGTVGAQSSYNLRIYVDNFPVIDTPVIQNTAIKELSFDYIFNEVGPHNITVQITPESDDIFVQNNLLSAVVDVIERPRLLLVTDNEASPLRLVLDEVYDLEVGDLNMNLGRFSAIVLDNQPITSIKNLENLREFLNGGGGLMVVGGNNSYGLGGYYESSFESLLPVKSVDSPRKKGETINVVILIDISGSTGADMAGETKIDVEKAIAVKMVEDLGETAHIGVAVFNSDSFLVQPVRRMGDTSLLVDKISKLKFGGGTYILVGLIRARDMLEGVPGSKYVILISDGITNYPMKAFEEGTAMAVNDITLHTIGVGFDTDDSFMKGLAMRGNGVYFEPSESERVKILMGGLEEEDGEDGFSMIITDSHHFITENLEISNISVKEFNEVTLKSGAQILASTTSLNPLLSVWRFGLGRVASLTVDDGYDWANRLYGEGNSKIISSTVNWIVGDPERQNDAGIDCVDTRVYEETPIIVTSKEVEYPPTMIGTENVKLSRLDEDNYYFDYYPSEVGFVGVSSEGYSCSMAINYALEYGDFGVDYELLDTLTQITGGKVYNADEIALLINEVSDYTVSQSTGVSIEKENMQIWFIIVAILLFFVDISIRRLREIRESRSK
jgi:uncharacterized membrane protein